ncbi:phosphomevalonate kinase [Streptomyces sp. NA04227]|uniref:phosphomevalonate kinase n=1 Tax=Streptomyces sp. NA04227 TaxID=2742136 RepID=UPI001163F037|nr:phosphomevalonate kinase [Streptomyces sp. NA04227]QDJ94219.1 SpzJ [Streptomyces sp.]QKW08102.1 phosphomevalonate kinase [Streptomyces sp. NA04227]
MPAQQAVTRRAPGKLFLLGEYAVLEPGTPSILMAVDRYLGVTVSVPEEADGPDGPGDGADIVVVTELLPEPARFTRQLDGEPLWCGPAEQEQSARAALAHILSVVGVLDALLAEHGRKAPAFRLSVSSELHEGGTKFGLGSSGAVTVASVAALAAYYGLDLTRDERFRLALLATGRLNASSSCGDLAASTFGGWITYRAPDRAEVVAMARQHGIGESLRAHWPGYEVRPLPSPPGLSTEIGWTGTPASTDALVSGLGRRKWRGTAAHRAFVAATDECVRASVKAIEQGDRDELLDRIRSARTTLAQLDEEVGLGVFTSRLTALCEVAEELGGAAKPSGAGGGDCGIALLPVEREPEIRQLRTRWAAAGVRHLPLRPAEVSTTERNARNDR